MRLHMIAFIPLSVGVALLGLGLSHSVWAIDLLAAFFICWGTYSHSENVYQIRQEDRATLKVLDKMTKGTTARSALYD